ncbi:unnamed protein product, partial [Tenebrio molitor]
KITGDSDELWARAPVLRILTFGGHLQVDAVPQRVKDRSRSTTVVSHLALWVWGPPSCSKHNSRKIIFPKTNRLSRNRFFLSERDRYWVHLVVKEQAIGLVVKGNRA